LHTPGVAYKALQSVYETMALVVTKAIESVQFTFYTEDEVRASSVKSITSPILFDNMNRPAPEGLYDPALGPVDQYGSCITCGEPAVHCPGHCGHIELVLPVYNPLVFKSAEKIMKYMCIFCHHFKLAREQIKRYAEKLELIMNGDIIGAKNLGSDLVDDELLSKEQREEHPIDQQAPTSWQFERNVWTSLQFTEAKAVLNTMMSEMNTKKCKNCGAKVPKITCPIFGRLYQVALPRKDMNANIIKGLKFAPLFGRESNVSDIVVDDNNPDELNPSSSGVSENQSMKDDVIDPSEAEESDTISKKARRSKGPKKQTKPKMNDMLGLVKEQEICSKDRFLTPLEIKEHLRLLWENESHICSLIWDIQQEKTKSWNQSQSHLMFFIEALLVPPSKFRPPNKLLEHPQNVLYSKVLQSNIALAEAIKAENNGGQSLNVVQTTNRWINLQDSVDVLIDSSTANSMRGKENTGIRQLLEKKEGLFRQNMMGKRVNYACRSVISPDPYIAVNEIGIPPYFAVRLTYPEKVTHWNVEKLRQAVRNGPNVYPGATHFEDEQGIVHLSSVSQYQRNSIAKKLLSTPGAASSGGSGQSIDSAKIEGKTVYRHLQDGDILLVNRQA